MHCDVAPAIEQHRSVVPLSTDAGAAYLGSESARRGRSRDAAVGGLNHADRLRPKRKVAGRE